MALRLRDMGDIRRFLSSLINAVRSGDLEAEKGWRRFPLLASPFLSIIYKQSDHIGESLKPSSCRTLLWVKETSQPHGPPRTHHT